MLTPVPPASPMQYDYICWYYPPHPIAFQYFNSLIYIKSWFYPLPSFKNLRFPRIDETANSKRASNNVRTFCLLLHRYTDSLTMTEEYVPGAVSRILGGDAKLNDTSLATLFSPSETPTVKKVTPSCVIYLLPVMAIISIAFFSSKVIL